MTCVYCEPKSKMRIFEWAVTASLFTAAVEALGAAPERSARLTAGKDRRRDRAGRLCLAPRRRVENVRRPLAWWAVPIRPRSRRARARSRRPEQRTLVSSLRLRRPPEIAREQVCDTESLRLLATGSELRGEIAEWVEESDSLRS